MSDLTDECDELGKLAVTLAPVGLRETFAAAFALDHRLSRIATNAKEPMLAQIRLAWWRDRLGEDVEARPRGDIVLDAIGRSWRGEESCLRDLVDGWEQAIGEAPGSPAAEALGSGRASTFASLSRLAGFTDAQRDAAFHGHVWGQATVALVSEARPQIAAEYVRKRNSLPVLPRALRPIALIGQLSARALKRGGKPLLGDRLSPLVAARIAAVGR
ncbi:hypothetical protein E3U23_03260 [Erythrobacter litoralis]|uniref:squalene/phytoene synthase family protein n=1 Tax=Erythrobacter litoralis TaxID=39960 RepID=UPI002434B04F|nr:squalene/phytoene synthase family protein [Erythrobacter litoralis]MDG6078206.1 hypothetical protein [Erythrobacter litoralis]